ncbi:DotA/TraY family protein [Pandoraea cepalis]|nr:DotA/TraY family protein [Pandoraea cepalis]
MRSRKLLAFALLLFAPILAWAGNTDSSTLFNLADNDLAKKLIFDGIFGGVNGSDTSGLGGAITIFNDIILTAAGFLAGYILVAGTMKTAHEGTFLGSWSSMWVPVRVAVGTAALLPVLNGYNVAQAVVLWVAMQGVGAANSAWTAFTQQPIAAASFIAPDQTQAALSLAQKMLLSNVCVQAFQASQTYNDYAAAASDQYTISDDTYAATPFNTAPTDLIPGAVGYTYGSTTGGDGNTSQCGEVVLQLPATGTAGLDTQSQTVNDLANMSAVNSAVQGAMQTGMTTMQAALVPIATQIAQAGTGTAKSPTPAAVNSALTAAASTFAAGVKQSLTSAPSVMNAQVQSNIQQDGFMFVGAWYMKLAKAGQMFSDAATAMPIASGQDGQRRTGNGSNDQYIDSAMTLTRNLIVQGQSKAAHSFTGLGAQANADSNLASQILNWFIADNNLGFGSDANALLSQNPVIGAAQLGRKMINWAWVALGAGATAAAGGGAAAGEVFGKLAGTDTAAIIAGNFLTPAFYMLFIPLIGAGVALSLIPMIPALMWGMGVIGYVALLVEAMLGASIWMLAHLHPEGDGVGRGGKGYALLLDLFLRPTLMVMGFIASVALMTPMGWFFSSLFIGAATESDALTGFAGLTVLIAMMMLYGGIQVVVIRKIFALIHAIPDQVLRWIGEAVGGGGHSLGEGMNQMGSEVGGAGRTLVGVLPSGMNGQGVSNAVQQLAERRKKRAAQAERDGSGSTPVRVPQGGGAGGGSKDKPEGGTPGGASSLSAARAQAKQDGGASGGTGATSPKGGEASSTGAGAGASREAGGATAKPDGAATNAPAAKAEGGGEAKAEGGGNALSRSLDEARDRMTEARDRLTDDKAQDGSKKDEGGGSTA